MKRYLLFILILLYPLKVVYTQEIRVPVEPSEARLNSQHQPEKLMDAIGLKEGMIIADIGAGRGRMTVWFADKVGEKGMVYANNIDKDALTYLEHRCQVNNITNVKTFTGKVDNPMLPAGEVDIAFMISTYSNIQDKAFPELTGPYLGQKIPGQLPELFAPEIIATGFSERDITISPDGKEIFYGFLTNKHITIMYTRMADGRWSEPEIAPFAQDNRYYYLEPCFSADGKTVYFLSTRPPEGMEVKPGWSYQNIWASDKKQDGTWDEIYNPDTLLNKLNSQVYPSLTKDGTIYFTRSDEQTEKSVILRTRREGNKFLEPELLPPAVNKSGNIFNAFISPDESYLIACVGNTDNRVNPGYANYYIFFRDNKDNWSEGISFSPEVNIKGSNAISASVSPDGRFLFFAARKISSEMQEKLENSTLKGMLEVINAPQNGNYDIYWVSAKIIEELRPKK